MFIKKIFPLFFTLLYLNSCQKAKENLNVCSELAYLPLEMKAKDGVAYGYEIDILKEFAQKQNYSISYFEVPWTASIPSLISKRCDMIASGMTATPERMQIVNFTAPIYDIVDNFVVKNSTENKNRFKTPGDFNKPGIKIGVRQGNEVAVYLKNNFKNAEILEYPNSDSDVINALLSNKVTVIALHSPTAIATRALNANKLFILPQPVPIPGGVFHLAYPVRKDPSGDKLRQQFNVFFNDFKNTPQFKHIYDYYFSSNAWIPNSPTLK